ncbi:MAG: hypothetical protein JWR85_3585 [Marmoricola sp.]|nr:hypothetical protein [Marmoricola sp.]
MAEVVLATALQKQTWSTEVTREYVRESGLLPYMGTEDTSIIRIRNELKTEKGDTINFPLVVRIKGRGVRGAEVLKGNEVDLGLYNTSISVDWIRQGVKIPKSTSFRTAIDIWGLTKPQLRSWSAELLRDDVIQAFAQIIVPGTVDAQGLPGTDGAVNYLFSTAGQRNTYLVNNTDRIVFGNARANISSGNWATSLGNVSIATGLSSSAHVRLLKTIAKTAGKTVPAGSTAGVTTNITPFKSDMTAGREWYVYFAGSREFSLLSQDATIVAYNTNARPREGDAMERNPLFQDGDLMYNGVLIREMPELDDLILLGAGSGGADLAFGFFCGQSAVAVAYGMSPRVVEDRLEDYEFRPGMAIEELRGTKKTSFGGVQYGIVTSVTALPALA